MPKVLIIAEKDSLAKKIANAIGKAKKEKDHYHAEGNGFVADVYYTFGHILEASVGESMKRAGYPERFPAFPDTLVLTPKKERKGLYLAIKKALERAKKGEYDYVVSAGDPDREGEILIREVLEDVKFPKSKVRRMWFDSETAKELLRALKEAKPLSEFDPLATAGELRKIGDFWVGINASIGLQRKTGNKNLSLGRVQTPVLRLIVERDLEIENFKPEKYFVIKAQLEKDGKQFWSVYQTKERLTDEKRARALFQIVKESQTFVVKDIQKKKKAVRPPHLPKLSDLQKEAGRKYGYSAKKVLSIVQSLYEAEVLTYPRTDSQYLATHDEEKVYEGLKALGREDLAGKVKEEWFRKRVFNDKDVQRAGHHAIIPIAPLPKNATEEQRKIYNLVAKRFLSQFYPNYTYEETTVVLTPEGRKEEFVAKGKVELNAGWKELYRGEQTKEKDEEESTALPPLEKGEPVKKIGQRIEEKWTQPPPRYTSASLIAVMEKLGLGEQSTRHTYEEVLKKRGYIEERQGKLISTERGRKLIESIKNLELTSPELTAEWDKLLKAIAERQISPDKGKQMFEQGIKKLTYKTVKQLDSMDGETLEAFKKKPTRKMIAFARSISKALGVEFDESRKEDYGYVKEFIDKHAESYKEQKKDEPPSEKQLALLKKLAEEGKEIPEEAYKSKQKASEVITKLIGSGKKKFKGRGSKGRGSKRRFRRK